MLDLLHTKLSDPMLNQASILTNLLLQETHKSPLILDDYMMKVVAWLLGFLFVSLVSIIVWLAKGVFNELKTIGEKQDRNREQIQSLEDKLSTMKEDLSSLKKSNSESNVQLNQLETKVALHGQWIRLRGGDIEWKDS